MFASEDPLEKTRRSRTKQDAVCLIGLSPIPCPVRACVVMHRIRSAWVNGAWMNIETLLACAKQRYGTVPDYPWAKFPDYAVLRHAQHRKWYCLAMRVQGSRLGLDNEAPVECINVKAPPELIGSFRTMPGVLPAYHMNKEHWITIVLNGGLSERDILDFVQISFDLTRPPPEQPKIR